MGVTGEWSGMHRCELHPGACHRPEAEDAERRAHRTTKTGLKTECRQTAASLVLPRARNLQLAILTPAEVPNVAKVKQAKLSWMGRPCAGIWLRANMIAVLAPEAPLDHRVAPFRACRAAQSCSSKLSCATRLNASAATVLSSRGLVIPQWSSTSQWSRRLRPRSNVCSYHFPCVRLGFEARTRRAEHRKSDRARKVNSCPSLQTIFHGIAIGQSN